MMVRPLHIRGAQIWDRSQIVQRDLYTADKVVEKPANGALMVDLDGYTIFPGLVNAHDHLELNHYPRSKFREKYDNAHQWGEDMNARLDTEPYKSLRAYPLWDRLFIGGLKNLLCGALTVAHHNPPHKELFRKDFPVRVLRKYGWAHSLHFSTDEEIVRSFRSTPPNVPWFIHLAEGTDGVAQGEYQRLKALGCIGKNTVIVHGVGVIVEDIVDAGRTDCIHGLVCCPTANYFLLGPDSVHQSMKIDVWHFNLPTIALGSDSRLTADGDLINELQTAWSSDQPYRLPFIGPIDTDAMLRKVTVDAAKVLMDSNIGHLNHAAQSDFIALREEADAFAGAELDLIGYEASRTNIALITRSGVPQIGDPDVMAKFPHIETVAAVLDGKPKRIHLNLARQIHRCSLKEPGLEVDELPRRKFWLS